jgi:hypothetical protein
MRLMAATRPVTNATKAQHTQKERSMPVAAGTRANDTPPLRLADHVALVVAFAPAESRSFFEFFSGAST